MKQVSLENCNDLFSKIAMEIEEEWCMSGLSGDLYEEYARAIFNRYIERQHK